ncbi:ferritin-like domain-containing protein [Peribacillus sp. SCS-155]|uniref:ferritin-like domain-containing protein n=1 Tax=Peribacillus sedimenti TaxID=3115297 RepID=UPI0039059955
MDKQQLKFENPPRAITTKDLLYLKDALSWELLAMKKFHFLAQQTENETISNALNDAGKMHQRHYEKLLAHLQVDNNQVINKSQSQGSTS